MENIEIWKDINGYEGLYQISNLGRVKSLDKQKWNRFTFLNVDEFFLNNVKTKNGYLTTALSKEGKRKSFKIHRLLAEHFIPNPENKPTVDHIDRNKSNNSLDNLRWATYLEQVKNRNTTNFGMNQRTENKLSIDKDYLIDLYINKNYSMDELSIIINIPKRTIKNILKRYDIKKNNSRFDN
jgi:hypothetical protein